MDAIQALVERHRFPKPKNDWERWVNRCADSLAALDTMPGTKVTVRLLKEREYKVAFLSTVYGASSSDELKKIPVDDLLEIIRYSDGDSIVQQYKERIRSPHTAIRSYCVTCQGGSPAAVRDCPSANCPLWAFRMGSNPFYGRMAEADAESDNEPEVEEAVTPADIQEKRDDAPSTDE